MLTQDDISAFEDDDAVLSRVADRMARGVAGHREFNAEDIRPLVRAALRWREIATEANLTLLNLHKQSEASMECSADPMRE